jgi:hypothetical protein
VYCSYCTCKIWKISSSVLGQRDNPSPELRVDRPFPYPMIRCWVRTKPPPPPQYSIGNLSPLALNPQYPETLSHGLVIGSTAQLALLDQPPPPDHLENHLIWVVSTKVIPMVCCRISLDRFVGTCKFPTTLVTLSLQLWNSTGTALGVTHEATWGAGELYHPPKGHEWACWKEI